MQKYSNFSGRSNVESFEIGENFIVVKFYRTARTYRYSYMSAGQINVENMKRLALAGRGLNAYINKHVKFEYER